jgi:hypothetical protein
MVLEVVSKEYNGEYDKKLRQYQELGILYYVIYNSLSGRRGLYKTHESLEVYKLISGKYELLPSVALMESGKVVWMPEIGLGIGCERRVFGNWERDWLYWYDRDCVRYPTAEERAIQERSEKFRERNEKLRERNEKEKLAAYLRAMGINPNEIL